MLQFEHPDYLWGLVALPALAAGSYLLYRHRMALLTRFVSRGLLSELVPDMSAGKYTLKHLSLLAGLGFLLVALANPQVGTRLEEVKREGVDLFVALDVSLSMKAEDIRPNRLEKAKRDVSNLLGKLEGDRVGLIVFAGDAFVQFPLTSDYSAADLFISAVDVDAVPTPGTMIARAIELALESFPEDVPSEKVIVIVTDGENTEGDIIAAVEEANKKGVKVYSVGMGTTEGGPIPIYSASGARVDYKRDKNGSIVLTKLDESTLQQIAASTGASYRRATSGGNEIDDVFKELSSLEKVEFGAKQVTGFESKYQYPLALAILFLFLEVLLSERRGTVLRWLKRFLPATAILLLVAAFSAPAQTHRKLVNKGNEAYKAGKYSDAEAEYKKALEKQPGSPTAHFNVGAAYYKQERYDESARSFQTYAATTERPGHSSDAIYNIGNSLFKNNKIQESIEAYKQTLRVNPNDEDARYNLQLAREKLKQQQNQQQQQEQDQQQQKDQQKNDQQNQQQDQKQEQQKQNPQQQDQQQQQPQTAKKNQIPKEQAERILEALRNNEKEIQKQLRKREGARIRTEKDW